MQNNFFFSETKLSLFNVENDYMIFEISENLYAVKILSVKEIVSNREIFFVEDLPEFFSGFANIRSTIFPVFDLKKTLSIKTPKLYGRQSVIIIFENTTDSLALLADSVLDIFNIPKESLKTSTVCKEKSCNFVDYEVDLNDRVVRVIDTEKILMLKHQM